MIRGTKFLVVAGSIASLALVGGTTPAQAAAAATAAIEGGGTISPGLTNTPTFQSVTFSGTAIGVGTIKNKVAYFTGLHCSFSGASTIAETAAKGKGHVNGSCSGNTSQGAGNIGCSIDYARTGNVVTISGPCSYSLGALGGGSGKVTGAFSFAPTSVNPTKGYLLQGSSTVH